MNEENKKEAQDAELNSEELDKVSGGYTLFPGAFYYLCFTFTEIEVIIIRKLLNVTLEAGRGYNATELKDFGIGEGDVDSVRKFLRSLGIYKS